MSDLLVALIAEGPTDAIIIEAALKAILDQPFILVPVAGTCPAGTCPGGHGRWLAGGSQMVSQVRPAGLRRAGERSDLV